LANNVNKIAIIGRGEATPVAIIELFFNVLDKDTIIYWRRQGLPKKINVEEYFNFDLCKYGFDQETKKENIKPKLKKASIGEGTKASHLTYLGDAKIGKNVNIGCGTITCNYDGEKKWMTIIGDDVFVGSDTQLVAPVRVGKGSYLGSGSTITDDVPAHSLSLTRAPQIMKQGWAKKRKKKHKKK